MIDCGIFVKLNVLFQFNWSKFFVAFWKFGMGEIKRKYHLTLFRDKIGLRVAPKLFWFPSIYIQL